MEKTISEANWFQDFKDMSQKFEGKISEFIQKKPFEVMIGAVAVGYGVARLVKSQMGDAYESAK